MKVALITDTINRFYNLNLPLIAEKDIQDNWVTIKKQLGFFGHSKGERIKGFNEQFGEENWRMAWQVKDKYVAFKDAIQLYENGYRVHFKLHPDILETLVKTASEVYDNSLSNIHSGISYENQENNSNHFQDISIRKIITQIGLQFLGKDLVKLRPYSKHLIGRQLSPGTVPFHKPQLISKPHLKGWWKANSIEDFYQSNKVLQVKLSELLT